MFVEERKYFIRLQIVPMAAKSLFLVFHGTFARGTYPFLISIELWKENLKKHNFFVRYFRALRI